MSFTEQIKKLAQMNLEKMQTIRRTLHANPELGFEEYETQKLVQQTLDTLGIEHQVMAKTGVVGLIKGGKPGKTVLLRADMDALPIEEQVAVPYKSTKPGLMHACGHDGHTANLLGVAMILNELKADLAGNVKLMFQPAEETEGGAEPMIQAGILENPHVDAAFGLHIAGDLPEGEIEVTYGPMAASPDEFIITVTGKGGHAASPHHTIDPVNIVVQFASSIPTIITRLVNPMRPAVISITKLQAGGAGLNIIPQTAIIGGSIRTMTVDVRELVKTKVAATMQALCDLYGATYDITYLPAFPPLINDHAMTDIVKQAAEKIVPKEHVIVAEEGGMGAEDFAFLTEAVSASYYHVGIKRPGHEAAIHHHPEFQWNDEVLEISAATLAQVAVDFLNSK